MSVSIVALLGALTLQQAANTPQAPWGPRNVPTVAGRYDPVGRTMSSVVMRHWTPLCDSPEAMRQQVQFEIALDERGQLVSEPQALNPQDDPHWTRAAEAAREALVASAPFEVPEGYTGGRYRPTFVSATACALSRSDEP